MTPERWFNIAPEIQKHIDAVQQIAERENMDRVSMTVLGTDSGSRNGIITTMYHIDNQGKHYGYDSSPDADYIRVDGRMFNISDQGQQADPGKERGIMGWNYKCRECGCYIDPGEGGLCDECREKEETKKRPIDTSISTGQHSRNHAKLVRHRTAFKTITKI